jgi:2-polyprenyl-3-methyl-5-hydroxy-6-metoxy-1,4-benzoquinol methylase
MSRHLVKMENGEMIHTEKQPTRFDSRAFPQYDRLSWSERLFLQTCCYFPPRPRRVRTLEYVADTDMYIRTFERAFGPELWSLIARRDVLDFGCGEGGFTLALAERGAGHVTGLDILPDFAMARAEAQRRNYALTFVGAASETLPDATYDVIISHDSFEHFDEPEMILAEMVRLARPGGRILIKFGPTWGNPWGRHMSGTIRRDRPWIHLVVSERTIMRAQSVYHNQAEISERYAQLPGGLNKMTVGRFKGIINRQPGVRLEQLHVTPIYSLYSLAALPKIGELFSASVRAIAVREGSSG